MVQEKKVVRKLLFYPSENLLKPIAEEVICIFCKRKGVNEIETKSNITDDEKPCWIVTYNHDCTQQRWEGYDGFLHAYLKE